MASDEVLIRLKMVHKVTVASNLKAAGLHFNKTSSKAAITKTAETAKNDFNTEAMKYNECLLGAVVPHTGLSSLVIDGLTAFDSHIMFKRPTEVALRPFDTSYATFLLRSWVSISNETSCRDEYVAILDYLRTNHSSAFDLSSDFPDLIEFFIGLDFFQTRQHICYLFKLCCLCITSVSPQYPADTMSKIDTTDFQTRVADVVMPCQSYLSEVPGSLALCCTDENLDNFSLLSTSFGSSGHAPSYDPWTFVDNFGR